VVPLTAAPEPTKSDPLLPELDVPVLRTRIPLEPAVPAFAVDIINAPLLPTEPYPLIMYMRPPMDDVDVDAAPAEITISPPEPLLPSPAEI